MKSLWLFLVYQGKCQTGKTDSQEEQEIEDPIISIKGEIFTACNWLSTTATMTSSHRDRNIKIESRTENRDQIKK